MRRHISGLEATRMAIESDKRGPLQLEPLPEDGAASVPPTTTGSAAPAPAIPQANALRKAPARVRKPSQNHDRCIAPTADLEAHRGVLRQAFGDTIADEFADQT